MKRLIVIAVTLGLIGTAMVASAANDRLNTCTSTYQLTGGAVTASGSDTAIARSQTAPSISVAKYAKNIRTGIEDANTVNAVSGDTVEFRIVWSNGGEADADTVTLYDYVPSNMTLVASSSSETTSGANDHGTVSEVGGILVRWDTATGKDIAGTDPGTAVNGVIKFRATVN